MMVGNVPIHWDRSDRMTFDVGSYISKSRAAIDRREQADANKNKNKKPVPGKVYYPIPRSIDGDPFPTWAEFAAEQAAKRGTLG
jgi:hypothetical protein